MSPGASSCIPYAYGYFIHKMGLIAVPPHRALVRVKHNGLTKYRVWHIARAPKMLAINNKILNPKSTVNSFLNPPALLSILHPN